MKAFSKMDNSREIKTYLGKVLSRTGRRTKKEAKLYHYTRIESLVKIIEEGYLWLTSPQNMDDLLEKSFIENAQLINALHYACFSRTNESLAMYRMYAPEPCGVMMCISVEDAEGMLKQKPLLVEGEEIQKGIEVDTQLF